MGYQIIKQPDGQLAIWSTYTDTLAMWDASRDEVVEFFVESAMENAARSAERAVDAVMDDQPSRVYAQFAMTWGEAVERDREMGGEYGAASPPIQ